MATLSRKSGEYPSTLHAAHLLSLSGVISSVQTLRIVGVLLLCLGVGDTQLAAASSSQAVRKARTQFETAERMREALNGRPAKERTRREYQRVADAFRKVYYVSPASSKADASVVAVAEILAEMGRQFPPGERDLHASILQYEFLRREYPGSKYRVEALFTMGQIYKEDLGDEDSARATFEEFLKRYPRSQLVPKAREALAELNQPKPTKKVVGALPVPAIQPGGAGSAAKNSLVPQVTGIRYWSTAGYTRVAIDLDSEVKYESGRVPDPDRIVFDLQDTRLVSTLVGKSFDVQDGFLKKIRIGQYQRASTRVVLEVDDVTEYSAFLLPNPYRLIIDIHGRDTRSTTHVVDNLPPEVTPNARSARSGADSAPSHGAREKAASKPAGTADANASQKAYGQPEVGATKTPANPQSAGKQDKAVGKTAQESQASTITPAFKGANGRLITESNPPPKSASTGAKSAADDAAVGDLMNGSAAEVKPITKPTTAPTAVTIVPDMKKGGSRQTAKTTIPESPTGHEAVPTSAGDRSLTRALGLKIGRIVIDAGHGGHDTGTIGPNGLQEKDLVLDVVLRLGRLLESKLGAEVIYTRDDDTFIPLETRTAIANEHQADLFISVHANSSQDDSARGVETYYLNFTSNPDALEVAARENAVSEKSIHELQDLVKKITLKEKIDESRELASDVQQSLYEGLSPKNPTLRNRGVKKAPFVVLIGANMPSILAEISFVSNPVDEAKLETPEYRQKIAESLYKGIAKYISGLSGLKVASKFNKEAAQ
jgi:N-acetylmuramoyl-L-alanine amidase